MNNIIYRRTESNWISGHGCANHSLRYWRAQARDIFTRFPTVTEIEVVRSGRKTDSDFIARGVRHAAPGQYVIVASTGGKWGRSRSDYR